MKTEIMTITPEMAKMILENNNKNNRKIRRLWVLSLANAIERGEWVTTHQGIAFDENGVLQDGQHRLSAIVLANKPVDMMVTSGVSVNNFSAIDQHAKRTISDATGIRRSDAEVCRIVAQIAFQRGQPTLGQINDVANDRLLDQLGLLSEYSSAAVKLFSCAPIRAIACAMGLHKGNNDYVFSSYRRLVTRDYSNMNDVEASFCRAAASGILSAAGSHRAILSAYIFYVFDEQNKHKKKIMILDVEKKYTDVQKMIRSVWPRV